MLGQHMVDMFLEAFESKVVEAVQIGDLLPFESGYVGNTPGSRSIIASSVAGRTSHLVHLARVRRTNHLHYNCGGVWWRSAAG